MQFHASEEASALSDAIAQAVGSDSGYEFDPHLSLLYKTMPEWQKEQLARDTRIADSKQVRFDALKLVSVAGFDRGRAEDVYAWRTIAEQRLGGGS